MNGHQSYGLAESGSAGLCIRGAGSCETENEVVVKTAGRVRYQK